MVKKSGHETGFSKDINLDFLKVVNPDFPKDKTMLQLKLPEGCCNRTNLL